MKDSVADQRQQAILQSAWSAFAAYGFRKTSMDDIARGAGMSRPALYLHYRNKEDIYRSLVAAFFEEAAGRFAAALDQAGPVSEVICHALLAKSAGAVEVMLSSPHGHELLDVKSLNAAEITVEGEARLARILADWLARMADTGALVLPADAAQVAQVTLGALKGLMLKAESYEAFVASVTTFARLVSDGLRPR